MPETLKEYIRSRTPGPFKPSPYYSKLGDFLTYFFEDADCCAFKVTPDLTLYRANEGGRIVGFKIKGVGAMVSP